MLSFPEDWDENNDEEDKGPKTKMTRRKMMWYVVDHWSVCWCDLSGWNVGLGKRRQFVPISSTSHHHTLAPSEHLDVLGEDLQHRSVEHVVLCAALRLLHWCHDKTRWRQWGEQSKWRCAMYQPLRASKDGNGIAKFRLSGIFSTSLQSLGWCMFVLNNNNTLRPN